MENKTYKKLLIEAGGGTLAKDTLDKERLMKLLGEGISHAKITKLFGFTDYEFRQLLLQYGLDKESAKSKYIDEVCEKLGEGVRRALLSCSYYERHKKVSNRKKDVAVKESMDVIEDIDAYIDGQTAIHGEALREHLWVLAKFEFRPSHLKAQADKVDCIRFATKKDVTTIRRKAVTNKNIVREPFSKIDALTLEGLLDDFNNTIIVYGLGGDVWGFAIVSDGENKSLEILEFVVWEKELKYHPTPGLLLKKIDEYAVSKDAYTIVYKMDNIAGLDKSFKVNRYDFIADENGSYLQKITPIGQPYFDEIARQREQELAARREQERLLAERRMIEAERERRIKEQRRKEKDERAKRIFSLFNLKIKGPEYYVEPPRREGVFVVHGDKRSVPPIPYRSDMYKILLVNQDNPDVIEKIWKLLTPQQLDTLLNIDELYNQQLMDLFHKSSSSIDKKMVRLEVGRTHSGTCCLPSGEFVYSPPKDGDEERTRSIADAHALLKVMDNEEED